MAFIPDEAVDRMAELSAGAWRLYCFLARCRNGKTGKCCPSIRVTAEAIDVHPKNVFKLRNELVAAGWVTFNADHAILILGFVSSKNATADVEVIEDTANGSKNTTIEADSSKNATIEEVMVAKTLPLVAKTLPDGSKNATAYKEEPANEPAKRTSKEEKDMSNGHSTTPSGFVLEVFTYWQRVLNHPQAKLTVERRKKIEARLKEKYSIEQIKSAIDGCRASPFHMGQGSDSDGTVYDDIELICRSGSKLEMFIAKVNNNGTQTNKTVPARTTEQDGIRTPRQL